MNVSWLEHLLADRGIRGHVRSAHLVEADGELYLDVVTVLRLAVFDGDERVAAQERHLVPLGGLVFA